MKKLKFGETKNGRSKSENVMVIFLLTYKNQNVHNEGISTYCVKLFRTHWR